MDLETNEGVVGHSYLFCYRESGAKAIVEIMREAAGLVQGMPVMPARLMHFLARQYMLLGVTGVARMALGAIDIALWDALAIAANMPPAVFLGGTPEPIRTCNSDGLGMMPAAQAADEAVEWSGAGFHAVKRRVGYTNPETDRQIARAVRDAIGKSSTLMVDYNQALTVPDAIQRVLDLADLDIYWL